MAIFLTYTARNEEENKFRGANRNHRNSRQNLLHVQKLLRRQAITSKRFKNWLENRKAIDKFPSKGRPNGPARELIFDTEEKPLLCDS